MDFLNGLDLLAAHGIEHCSYYAGGDEKNGFQWDYVVFKESQDENTENYLQFNVLNVSNDNFSKELNKFNQEIKNLEEFNFFELAKFFEKQGYDVMTPYFQHS